MEIRVKPSYGNENLKTYYLQKTDFLLKVLTCFGFVPYTSFHPMKKKLNGIFHVFIFLVFLNSFIANAFSLNLTVESSMLSLIYLITLLLSTVAWFKLLNEKVKIISLIYLIKARNTPFSKTIEHVSFSLICLVPFVYSIIFRYISIVITGTPYTYGCNIKDNYLSILASVWNAFSFGVTYPTTTNVVAFIYCSFCSRMCRRLRRLTSRIDICTPHEFDITKQVAILKMKDKMDDAFRGMHSVFSVPSFCVLVAHFCFCCSLLGWVMLGREHATNLKWVLHMVFFGLNSLVSLVVILWVVGGVPMEMEKFRLAFKNKIHKRRLSSEKTNFEDWLDDGGDFVFSGCDILCYRRSSILTLVGTILTYTLLLLNWME